MMIFSLKIKKFHKMHGIVAIADPKIKKKLSTIYLKKLKNLNGTN